MNKKISIVALLFAFGLLIPMASAAFSPGNVNIYLWADKTQYQPGDTITIHFTMLNARSSDLVINQVNIETPWFNYIQNHWEGNQTMIINKVVTAGTAYSNSTTLQIPNDSRGTAYGTSIDIDVTITTNAGTFSRQITVNIANPPFTVSSIDTLVLLQAVLIILIVVCTALIAAAIFLSARKPQEAYSPPPPSQSTP
ncbi:MAG TPA: hypothetical protein VMS95_06975 [Candidatus Krumholzibacteriaceae bacterium]|nr:hypothetical protein [Candidatus Krumholzibacteriaceae bacterium]